MASSVLKNDHSAPGGAITTAAIVKHEPEHNQSLETPGDRQETSGNLSLIILYILTMQLIPYSFNACLYSVSQHIQTKSTNGYKGGV